MGLGTTVDSQEHGHLCHYKWMSWTAVIMGALVAIGLSFLFNLFNVAIGLSIFTNTPEGTMSLAIGGFVALLIGVIVSMFVAGWVSGYLAKPYCRCNLGILYGFITWALALLITVLTMTHVGRYMASLSNAVANPTMIIMTENENVPMVRETPSKALQVSAPKAARTMGVGAFITFILFFVGAVSTCTGAHIAMSCEEKCGTRD